MGLKTERFENQDLASRLKCSICNGVFEDPVQCPEEHIYCRECITSWLETNQTCHEDGHQLTIQQLSPCPKIVREFVAQLVIKCGHELSGCPVTFKLLDLEGHMQDCEFAPSKSIGVQADIESKEVNHLKRKVEELNQECEVSAKRIKTLEDVKTNLSIKVEKDSKQVQTELLSVDIANLFKAKELVAVEAKLSKECESCVAELKKRKDLITKLIKSNKKVSLISKQKKILQDELDATIKKLSEQTIGLNSVAEENVRIKSQSSHKLLVNPVPGPSDPRRQSTSSNLSPSTIPSDTGPKLIGAKSGSRVQTFLDGMICRKVISIKLSQLILQVDGQMKIFNGDFCPKDLELTAIAIRNAFDVIKEGHKKVLNLIECPLIAVCLSTMLTKCTFIISHRLKATIVESGFSELLEGGRLVLSEPFKSKFAKFDTLGCPKHGPFDLILFGCEFLNYRVRQMQLKDGGEAYSAINDFFV